MAGNARLVAMVGRNLLACRNSLQRVELNKIINRCFCDDSARKIEVKVEIVDEGADVRTCAHSTIKMGGRVFTSAKSSENDVERRTKRGSKRQFPKRKVRQGPVIELSSTRFFGAATWSLESRSIHDRLCRRDRPRLPAIEAHTVAVDGEFYPGWSIGTPLGAMAIGGGRSKLQWTPSGRPNALRSFDAPVFHDSCHLFQLTITAHIPANWVDFTERLAVTFRPSLPAWVLKLAIFSIFHLENQRTGANLQRFGSISFARHSTQNPCRQSSL